MKSLARVDAVTSNMSKPRTWERATSWYNLPPSSNATSIQIGRFLPSIRHIYSQPATPSADRRRTRSQITAPKGPAGRHRHSLRLLHARNAPERPVRPFKRQVTFETVITSTYGHMERPHRRPFRVFRNELLVLCAAARVDVEFARK